jgi:hypothetical protein
VLRGEATVHSFEEKAAFFPNTAYYDLPTGSAGTDTAVKTSGVVDLTSLMRSDGSLDWTPPAGEWLVLRIGYSLTGAMNRPASPEATGLEVDKLDRDAERMRTEKDVETRQYVLELERRRAEAIRAACEQASRLEQGTSLTLDQANARLLAIRGVGPWTAAEVARTALGDADAISVGDFHLPNVVCWALAREPRGTDERMLELLEPYRGHRGRVQVLLEAGNISAPAFGPRMEVRSIERI